jgi:predicted TPR repeat methyltransferase
MLTKAKEAHRAGRWAEAITHYNEVLMCRGEACLARHELAKHYDAHVNLGHCYAKQDDCEQALFHYQISLEIAPHPTVQLNAGLILVQMGRFEEAKPLLLAIKHTSDIHAWYHLALTHAALGETEEAIELYLCILALNSTHEGALHNVATLYLQTHQPTLAESFYAKALEQNSDNVTARHMLAALRGETPAEGAPPKYVQTLFDHYAATYNQHLKQVLGYAVPQHLRALLGPHTHRLSPYPLALDLGCGTGLMAPYLADIVATLVGVDLSGNMLKIAAQQGGYQSLLQEDIIEALKRHTGLCDLLIAADVLGYLGPLETLFGACKQALKPNGLWGFSIETAPHTLTLQPTGRFAHPVAYIQALCHQYRFTCLAEQSLVLRLQEQIPVAGHLFLLAALS